MSRSGALNVAYAIRRGRAAGGRLYREAGGGAEVPEEETPVAVPHWLQTGLEDTLPAPAPPPTRTYRGRQVADWSQRDPDEAYEASRDKWGYMRDHPGETALGVGSVAAPVAGGIISSAMENASPDRPQQRGLMPMNARRAAPESGGVQFPGVGSLMDMIGPSSAHAAEGDDPRPTEPVVTPNEQEASEISRINGLIAAKREELKLANTMRVAVARDNTPIPQSLQKKESAVRAAQMAIEALQGDLARVHGDGSPLGLRRANAMKNYNTELSAWNERQKDLINRNVNAGLPYAVKHADRQDWLQKYGPAISLGTGAVIGATSPGKFVKPLLYSAGVGAGEGAFTAAWPTINDATWGRGKVQEEAGDKLFGGDKELWRRIGAGAAGDAGAAAVGSAGATKGMALMQMLGRGATKARDMLRRPPPEPVKPPVSEPVAPSPVAGVGAAPAAAPPAAAPRPKAPPKEYVLPDGTTLKMHDLGKRGQQWRWSGNKNKVISAEKAAELRGRSGSGAGMPSSALHAPPSEARGGGIRSPMDIAYAIRRQQRAEGGAVHAGPIMSSVPGRTDNHPMDVEEGAYILPADHVSSLGEGNTMAGMQVVNHMIESLGADPQHRGDGEPVPINAAGGEVAIPPAVVMAIGGGDIKRGHEMLDQWVMMNRRKHISTLRNLPGPAKS